MSSSKSTTKRNDRDISENMYCANRLCCNLGNKRCADCSFFLYCSSECQLEHWNEHKPYCKKLSLAENQKRIRDAFSVIAEAGRLQDLNCWEECLSRCREALTVFVELVGENDFTTANLYGSLGVVLREQGRHEEALVELRKELEIFRILFGENNSNTANTYEEIGITRGYQGRNDDSLIGFGKALAIRIKLVGENHPDTARTFANIGNVLLHKEQYEHALEKFCKAEAIYKRELGRGNERTAKLTERIRVLAEEEGLESAVRIWRTKFSTTIQS